MVVLLIVGLTIAVAVALLALRYLPVVDDVRGVRQAARRLSVQAAALSAEDIDQAGVDELRLTVAELDKNLDRIRGLVTDDPLVGLVRDAPLIGPQVQAADALVGAADSLVEASVLGLDLADRVVALREANEQDPSVALLPELVELMAISTAEVDRIGSLVDDASSRLDTISPDAIGPILEARDLVLEPLDTYAPLLEAYRDLDDVLPGVLGWGGEKRYLILAQNPAELRPTGGYSGTIGVVTLRDGAVVEQRFSDVHSLDRATDLPFVEAPAALVNHLLGADQSWRLADANWSPDFPTSAQQALEFYELEAGDSDIDGVITVTTFALDRLLEVVGAVAVDDFAVTVEPGDTTLVLLGATRGGLSVDGRKDVLDALAREVMVRLLRLPPEQWVPLLEAMNDIGEERLMMAWFKDDEAQRFATESGWAGPVRQDAGDYLYVVESNVAPTSKYNLAIDRARSHVVKLDEDGNALTSVRLDWQNDADKDGQPYEALRGFSTNQEGWYGAHVRVLVPARSELLTVSGSADSDISGPESVAEEAGRAVFANYLLMPPGESTVTYFWSTPGAATRVDAGWEYRLLLQKQPGARVEPVAVRIDLPRGAAVIEASEGAIIDGERVRFETMLTTDAEFRVLYSLAGEDDDPDG